MKKKNSNCEVMDMLSSMNMVDILQGKCTSNHQATQLKYIHFNFTSIKLGKKISKKQKHRVRKDITTSGMSSSLVSSIYKR